MSPAVKRDWKAIAQFMLVYEPECLLQRPSSIADLEREARESLAYAAQRRPFALHCIVSGVDDTLSFLMAARKPGIMDAPEWIVDCLRLKRRLDETIQELKKDKEVARLIDNIEQAKSRHAERFCGTGTRGLQMNAPRNRLVIRLFDYMGEFQERWQDFVPDTERENFKSTLQPTLQKIVSLPALSRASALQYHQVGCAMLRDAAGKKHFTFHAAFEAGGEFFTFKSDSKTPDSCVECGLARACQEATTDRRVPRKRLKFTKTQGEAGIRYSRGLAGRAAESETLCMYHANRPPDPTAAHKPTP